MNVIGPPSWNFTAVALRSDRPYSYRMTKPHTDCQDRCVWALEQQPDLCAHTYERGSRLRSRPQRENHSKGKKKGDAVSVRGRSLL